MISQDSQMTGKAPRDVNISAASSYKEGIWKGDLELVMEMVLTIANRYLFGD